MNNEWIYSLDYQQPSASLRRRAWPTQDSHLGNLVSSEKGNREESWELKKSAKSLNFFHPYGDF
jgi:hypothetical protein